jgi:hypothetical protein
MVKATVGSKAPIVEPKRGKGKASAPAATEDYFADPILVYGVIMSDVSVLLREVPSPARCRRRVILNSCDLMFFVALVIRKGFATADRGTCSSSATTMINKR